jgi:glucose-6-phosphate 1-epimerase
MAVPAGRKECQERRLPRAASIAFAVTMATLIDGVVAFTVPSTLPARALRARIPVSSRPRGAAPLGLAMSFIPDKKAMEENFCKIPDHIVLRDPVELTDGSTKEKVTINSNGACVTSYVTGAGYDVLFCRPDAVFDGSKPISGGVPICWPQFGPGDIQQHGFARNLKWECVDVREETPYGSNQGSWISANNKAVFELRDSAETRKMWDHRFQARYEIQLKGGQLNIQFRVENKGYESFDFTCALHTYFAVDDIDNCVISGLGGKTYLDKTQTPAASKQQEDALFKVEGAPVERIYGDVKEPVVLKDGGKSLVIKADPKWKDIVLWNPYGNEAMGYKNFICIENGVIHDPVKVKPGEMWIASVSYAPYVDGMPAWTAAIADE